VTRRDRPEIDAPGRGFAPPVTGDNPAAVGVGSAPLNPGNEGPAPAVAVPTSEIRRPTASPVATTPPTVMQRNRVAHSACGRHRRERSPRRAAGHGNGALVILGP